jgi:D-beta-D-heptose 7-phosphate kinase/D-beta-D-heptose 1-phosphate adenosyltransferase
MYSDIPDFSTTRILVIGDLMLDRYWHGTTARISPEAPVPVVSISDIEERAGGAGNVRNTDYGHGCFWRNARRGTVPITIQH